MKYGARNRIQAKVKSVENNDVMSLVKFDVTIGCSQNLRLLLEIKGKIFIENPLVLSNLFPPGRYSKLNKKWGKGDPVIVSFEWIALDR